MFYIGWLRSVGSIKLQVSFAEYRLFYRSLLQKKPIILSILLTVATPYRESLWVSAQILESQLTTEFTTEVTIQS